MIPPSDCKKFCVTERIIAGGDEPNKNCRGLPGAAVSAETQNTRCGSSLSLLELCSSTLLEAGRCSGG